MIPHLIRTRILNPPTGLRVLTILEQVLFPLDGYPAPTPPDPTDEQSEAMRVRLVARQNEVIPGMSSAFSPAQLTVRPGTVQQILLPGPTAIDELLAPLGDRACNAHLVAMVYDAVIAALLPDLVAPEHEVEKLAVKRIPE